MRVVSVVRSRVFSHQPPIGPHWSRDLNTDLWLVETDQPRIQGVNFVMQEPSRQTHSGSTLGNITFITESPSKLLPLSKLQRSKHTQPHHRPPTFRGSFHFTIFFKTPNSRLVTTDCKSEDPNDSIIVNITLIHRHAMTGVTRIVTHAGPFHCDEVSSQSSILWQLNNQRPLYAWSFCASLSSFWGVQLCSIYLVLTCGLNL